MSLTCLRRVLLPLLATWILGSEPIFTSVVVDQYILPYNYTDYQLHMVKVVTVQQLQQVVECSSKFGMDRWTEHPVDGKVAIMTKPNGRQEFLACVKKAGVESQLVVENIQKHVDAEQATSSAIRRKLEPETPQTPTAGQEFAFNRYLSYTEIVDGIQYYADKYEHVEKTAMSGTTFKGLDIIGAKITAKGNNSRPIVFVECGIHAREWISTAVCNFLIHQFAASPQKHRRLLEKFEFHIYPTVNPDGYQRTKIDRFRRKNLRPTIATTDPNCIGTDLNRNFDIGLFCSEGGTQLPCDEEYCGTGPFSEPETQAMRDTILPLKDRLEYYFSFHSYGQLWMIPFSYKSELSKNHAQLLSKATKGAEAVQRLSGTTYKIGTIASTIYKVTGASVDWVHEKVGVNNTFIIELPPESDSSIGFLLPDTRIKSVCEETFVGVREILLS